MAKIILTVDGAVLKEVPLDKDRISIGRRATNDLVINHVAVSGVHAAVVLRKGEYVLEDLNSTNGTQVNGRAISRTILRDQDVVEITPYQITFHEGTAQQPQASAASGKPAIDEVAADAENFDGHTVLQQFVLLRVLDGPSAGKEMTLSKPVTTFGRPGVQIAVLTQKKQSYFLSHVEGETYPLVNGVSIGQNARMLRYDDVIDLSGTKIVFCRDDAY